MLRRDFCAGIIFSEIYMKKLVILLAFIMLFSSCSKNIMSTKEVSAAASRDFTAAAKIISGGQDYGANITKNGSAITFSIMEPKEIAGLEMTHGESGIKVSFGGAEEEFAEDSFPKEAPLSLFCEMLSMLSLTEDFVLSTEGKLTKAEGENFILKMLTADGAFVSVNFPECGTEILFEEFAFSA